MVLLHRKVKWPFFRNGDENGEQSPSITGDDNAEESPFIKDHENGEGSPSIKDMGKR